MSCHYFGIKGIDILIYYKFYKSLNFIKVVNYLKSMLYLINNSFRPNPVNKYFINLLRLNTSFILIKKYV